LISGFLIVWVGYIFNYESNWTRYRPQRASMRRRRTRSLPVARTIFFFNATNAIARLILQMLESAQTR
jgi:hypothetical protein